MCWMEIVGLLIKDLNYLFNILLISGILFFFDMIVVGLVWSLRDLFWCNIFENLFRNN